MRIDPRDAGRVEVIADIESTTPISPRTVAELDLQGVTGLLYIDLQQSRAAGGAVGAEPRIPGDPLRRRHSSTSSWRSFPACPPPPAA